MKTETVDLRDLTLRDRERTLVRDVSLQLVAGRITALVGPSGSGKTLTARALLGLTSLHPGVTAGSLRAAQLTLDLATARDRAYLPLRGPVLGYLPQNARASLDPLWTVARTVTASAARGGHPDPTHWLELAGFARPKEVLHLFPHQLSGGMSQRVALAAALSAGSPFLIADEPTTGLDPTVQASLLAHLRALVGGGMGLLFITHDLRLLPGFAHEVLVMDSGTIHERVPGAALATGDLSSEAGRRLLSSTRVIASGVLG